MALVADFWRVRGWNTTIHPTKSVGHAAILARQAVEAGHRLVLAAGGDGTLGEVANGLAGTGVAMAPLPIGTANSFARELHMPLPGLFNPHRLLQATDALAAGRVQAMDLGFTVMGENGEGNGRYWLLWAGVGADGFLVSQLEPRPKWTKRVGPLSYVIQGVPVMLRLPPMTAVVDVDGRSYSDDYLLILVSNSRRYVGGMLTLSPRALLDDGLFEIWLLRGRGVWRMTNYLAQAKWGDLARHGDVIRLSGQQITVHTSPPFPFQTDGEPAGTTPFSVEIRPRALHLLVPKTAPPDLFTQPGTPLAEWEGG